MKRGRLIAAGIGACAVLGVVLYLWFRHDDDMLQVPVGVENAVVIRYGGPLLEVRPFKKGVAVNLRIARVQQDGADRVYDIRYIVNTAGTFDISKFLQISDGSEPPGMLSFVVNAVERSESDSASDGGGIEYTEPLDIRIGHHYYEGLALVGLLWIVWLLLIIFYGRKKDDGDDVRQDEEKTFEEILEPYLDKMRDGTLDAAERAELETLMFGFWRGQLGLTDCEIFAALGRVGSSSEYGAAYDALEEWLHNPAASGSSRELLGIITESIRSAVDSGMDTGETGGGVS